jgi:diguanylate cyclase (GGDEF)-like protein
MQHKKPQVNSPQMRFTTGVLIPIGLAALVIWMDYLEGPTTAFIGVITCVTFMSAIFARPLQTAFVGLIVVFGSYLYGLTSEDAGTDRQLIRLALIALASAAAVFYSSVRTRQEEERISLVEQRIELEAESQLGMHDQLTGLLNRRGVIEELTNLGSWPRHVVVFDLDKLKFINDSYGHLAGDACIKIVAQRIRSNVSSADILGRWGGDEFILISPISGADASKMLNRVIEKVTEEPLTTGANLIFPKLSAGAAEWLRIETFDQSVAHADGALYEAKHSGGNKAVFA